MAPSPQLIERVKDSFFSHMSFRQEAELQQNPLPVWTPPSPSVMPSLATHTSAPGLGAEASLCLTALGRCVPAHTAPEHRPVPETSGRDQTAQAPGGFDRAPGLQRAAVRDTPLPCDERPLIYM